MLKRILIICIAISMVLSPFALAAEDNDAADQLYKIGIIRGDGTGLNLEGQLKRSEAVTLIVRLLGAEKEAMEKENYYTIISLERYSDINIAKNPKEIRPHWSAPYVGYLSEKGIVSGNTDGTFQPERYLSEKELLKMLMSALGYVQNVDFTMADIYAKAYDLNIVRDSAYKTKTADNRNFKRKECFDLIRSALDAKYKDSDETIITQWIKNGVYTLAQLRDANFITDYQKTAITKIEVVNATTVKVFFNEEVEEIKKDDIKINYGNNNILQVNAVESKGDSVTITTASQEQQREYTITFTTIKDKLLNEVNNVSGTFKGYKPEMIESNKFLISKIEPVSKDTIKVYFTQDISAVPTVPMFYDIYEEDKLWIDGNSANMYIAKLTDSNRGVIIRLLGNEYNIFKTYTLRVDGTMTDFTGIRINDGKGDSMTFAPLVIDNLPLKRELTYGYSKDVVTIEFNKLVDPVTAQTVGNFQILDNNNSVKTGIPRINPDNPKQVLIGMLDPLTPGVTYKLNIVGAVKDLEQATSLTETGIEFTVADEKREDLKIILVETVSNSELRVYFNKNLHESTLDLAHFQLSSSNDYEFTGINIFSKYYYDAVNSPKVVMLYLDPSGKKMKSSCNYTLKVTENVKDYLWQSNGDLTFEFTGNSSDKVSPRIISGYIVGNNTVKLEFDKPISGNNNSSANYKLKYRKADDKEEVITPDSATVFNNKYVILRFNNGLDMSKIYKVEYLSIMDYNENAFAGGSSNEFTLGYAY